MVATELHKVAVVKLEFDFKFQLSTWLNSVKSISNK